MAVMDMGLSDMLMNTIYLKDNSKMVKEMDGVDAYNLEQLATHAVGIRTTNYMDMLRV